MREKWEGTVGIALITLLLVMACIGWAKYVDEKREVEVWQTYYADAMDDWRIANEKLGDTEFMYQSCIHDRDYCKNALDATPVCVGAVTRIEFLEGQLDSCNRAYAEERHNRKYYQDALESHYDGLHCTWEPCTMLYECAFGELGWIGPDRVICDVMGNTTYHEARMDCYSDRNCSSCLEMTNGNLGHCWAFAYYP